MALRPDWLYDEFCQIGTDYEDEDEVCGYDSKMRRIRDVDREVEEVLACLPLGPDERLLEIGTGTGQLAIAASRRCRRVYAADVSLAMLRFARDRAQKAGADNVEFCLGGFLTYCHKGPLVDAAVTQLALHHLPDFWKQVALLRLAEMIRPGGLLFLKDVIYTFDPVNYATFFPEYLETIRRKGGDQRSVTTHISKEHSTMGWIVEGMLVRAGFSVTQSHVHSGFMSSYLCRLTAGP
ncbi:MAG: hypothetical protein A4E45_00278 [Methanosaeta sp. PtaB.Bin039]|nr:MAG: hypothetical protein A4E45_00278 [Methanosaeta sp. PtaB.Bin039]OPY45770.1 MAG: hypothetical protein A4E47_00843 [Methanosaeta sp. PtaU1.Bin028]HOT07142.1 class I SAM-dependent methyltransferase [Methanotrichaceae archaeon]HQF16863.1 class I SAM-dependent methyltransferase [Methanotrichaceae archaeon]HQI91429.1 class I SAM-dependent methyltransferase [Methanotrichaceae archaeon]